ncbi:MAG TPA: AraC family transcriptional regulator [Polyangiaceae bacterium]|nr:AraC family transcriptional regulator [Polyangiaceae bacterium]
MTNQHRSEYLRRIHRAQDFIEQHLAEPLPLEAIAQAAMFSPYHFHRVFTSVVGETLYQFVLRLRLEKAACQLVQNPEKSITAIAIDCGFSSSATFARAFKACYDVNASEWRAGESTRVMDGAMVGRKNRKALSKDGKAGTGTDSYLDWVGDEHPPARSFPVPIQANNVTVEQVPNMTVAYVRHVGPYAGDDTLFARLYGRLMAWAGPRGLLGPNTKTLTIYHDNPDLTDADKLRISCSVTVPPGTKSEGEVGIMELPAGKYAKARYEIDPTQYAGAWQWFMSEWMPSSGYQPDDGLCYELYLNDPKQHPQGKHIFEITMPVRPL